MSQSEIRQTLGVLLIHGFGGSPWEVAPLAQALEKRGCIISVPILKGHGENRRRAMAKATRQDWIDTADQAFQTLRQETPNIVLIGFSTGCLIAAHLALRYKPQAMVMLSAPMVHWDVKRITLNLIQDLKTRRTKHVRFYLRSTVKFPIRALLEFKRLQHETRPLFERLPCAVLLLQGLDDDTVHPKSAAMINKRIQRSGNAVETDYFEPAGHVLLQGPAQQAVIERVLRYLNLS